jgi:hypothetical protein
MNREGWFQNQIEIRPRETPDPEIDEAQYLYSNVAMLLSLRRAEFQHQRIHWIL